MLKQKLIGILGGLGPEAGRLLHGYIIEEAMRQKNITCDQDHCDVIHMSLPSFIPDRASYIFDQTQPDPTPVIYNILMSMNAVAESYGRPLLVCIPCNTYHAPVLFNPLLEMISKNSISHQIQVLNLIEESAKAVRQLYPDLSRVGLISTSGERASGIYNYYLKQQDLDIIQADDLEQKSVDEAIYHPIHGLKAKSQGTPAVRKILQRIVCLLQERGAEVIILGCTELPFAFDHENFTGIHFLSPMRIMAQRLVEKSLDTF